MTMRSRLTSLPRSERGTSAIEFAFIAPLFVYLIYGVYEMGWLMRAQAQLQGGAQVAAREIIVSDKTESEKKDMVKAKIEQHMKGIAVDPSGTVEVKFRKFSGFSRNPETFTDTNGNGSWNPGEPYTDRNSNGKWDSNSATEGSLGGVGEVVEIEVNYPVKPLTSASPWLALFKRVDITAKTAVRNEPE